MLYLATRRIIECNIESMVRTHILTAMTAALLVAGSTLFAYAAFAQTTAVTTCALEPGPTRAVTGVIDGETISLDDGTELRLVGALAPRPPDAALDLSYWPPEREAKAALERLVLGRSVTLAYAGRKSDRYGRMLAHVFVDPQSSAETPADPENRVWVQAHMLSHGHSRAYALKDSHGCLRELVAHEAIARKAKLGLWSHAAYQLRDASRTMDISRLRSTFQVIEGEVSRVIVSKTSLILRFNREETPERPTDQASDDVRAVPKGFSVSIKPAIARSWQAGGMTLSQLEGKRVQIRGWIERRGGPAIEIIEGNQIELVPADEVDALGLRPAAVATEPEPDTPRRRSRKRKTEAALVPASAP